MFISKRRKKAIYGAIRKHLREVFYELARQKGGEIVEGHLCADHVHMCVSVPRKFSNVIGYIKGKSAISIARNFAGKRRNLTGENFRARGYYVSTVGLDEDSIRQYIRNQEAEDERLEQLHLCHRGRPSSEGSCAGPLESSQRYASDFAAGHLTSVPETQFSAAKSGPFPQEPSALLPPLH